MQQKVVFGTACLLCSASAPQYHQSQHDDGDALVSSMRHERLMGIHDVVT